MYRDNRSLQKLQKSTEQDFKRSTDIAQVDNSAIQKNRKVVWSQ